MKQITKKIVALLLILAMVAIFPWAPLDQTAEAAAATQLADLQDAVTLHCWNWSYKAIEQKMATIAGMGYTAIQVSPIQQAKQATAGFQFYDWWVYYQPASFSIDNTGTSALGNKAEFKSMCSTAHKYGISVIVDVVANHMANDKKDNTLSPTIIADLRNDSTCWHNISKNTTNYYSRHDITQYCMDGVPDLNTASKKVQSYVLSYLKECVDAGADGFRFDGAKHIETPDDSASFASDFWPTIINGIKAYKADIYLYGEVLFGTDENSSLPISAYTKYMSVTDNTYGGSVRSSVITGKNAAAFSYQYHKSATADKLVIWAECHDDWASEESSTAGISKADINKTWALIAARADAMALYLARPNSIAQQLGTASSGTGWDSLEVAYINRFHNKFIGQSEYIANQNGIAYVIRGNSGMVLVNCSGTTKTVSITNPQNTMKNGTYTDQITGSTFTVANGKISGKIGASGIAVVYDESPCKHTSHNAEGICAACGLPVGHHYHLTTGICTVCGKNGNKTVYFRNTAGWSKVYIYAWTGDTQYTGVWPGVAMTHVEGDLYSYKLTPGCENVIFHNAGGVQTADLLVPTDSDNLYTFYSEDSGSWSYYNDGSAEVPKPTAGTTAPTTKPTAGTTAPATKPSAGSTSPTIKPTAGTTTPATKPTAGTTTPTAGSTTPSAGTTAPTAGSSVVPDTDLPTDTMPTEPGTAGTEPQVTAPNTDATPPASDSHDNSGGSANAEPDSPADNAGSSAGGGSASYWWVILVAVSAIAIVLTLVLRPKKNSKE